MRAQTRRILVLFLIYLGSAVGLTFLVIRKEKKEVDSTERIQSTDAQSHAFDQESILNSLDTDV